MESHKRSIAKTITWRIIAAFVTALVAFLFTKSVVLSVGVGLSDTTIKLFIYYLHERAWNRVDFGRRPTEIEKVFKQGGGI